MALRARAMEISREAARILKKKYGATRVALFGSLARSSMFATTSDIDLYAEGVPGTRFLRLKLRLKKSQRVSGWILSRQRNVPLIFSGKLKTKESIYEAGSTTGGEENKGRTC